MLSVSQPLDVDGLDPHSLDIRLMQCHQAGMNAHTDGRQMKVVEQHRQMVMQSASRMKIQLEITCGGQSKAAA